MTICLAAAVVGVASSASSATEALAPDGSTCDFDGDGFDDLAVGVPYEDIGAVVNAGAVQAILGSDAGLTAAGNQWWDQGTPGIQGGREAWDRFGLRLACGDFDGNGFDDLAVGVPNEWIGATGRAGAVQVIPGSVAGLTADGNQWWDQDTPGIQGVREPDDLFGWSLAVGDFDADGFDDLAIGVPYEGIGATADAGAVQVISGSDAGLTADGNQWWDQDTPGIQGVREYVDLFGRSLTVGDFDADGFDDLAIGVPNEDIGVMTNAGAVQVISGSDAGLTADGNQWWDQDTPGIRGARESGDLFGLSLTVGDFGGDGFDDLAIGVPFEDIEATTSGGAVQVISGSDAGLTADGNQWWDQDTPGIQGVREPNDLFGLSLTVGDFEGDGFDDLAIGVPEEDIGAVQDAGAVQVISGSDAGLTADGNQWWDQDTPAILGVRELEDFFGWSLAVGDFDGDGFDELAIGVAYEDIGAVQFAGAVQVIIGSDAGLTANGNQWWDQGTSGILGGRENGDQFGDALVMDTVDSGV